MQEPARADVTSPTPDTQVKALGALLGMTPGSKMDKNMALVALIAEAQRRGMSWAQIAPTLGCANGKAAKATAKRLARAAQHAMLAASATALREAG